MDLYARIMGSAIVYDRLRPMLLGGFDFSEVYEWLETGADDVVFDVGCGTGHSLDYIDRFHRFYGYDPDETALSHLHRKHANPSVRTEARTVTADDVDELAPSKVILMGILHHLPDSETSVLFESLTRGGTVKRIITLDPVYRTGFHANNLLGWLDRGRFVRTEESYRALIERAGFDVLRSAAIRSGNGLAHYFSTCLIPRSRSA